MPNKIKTNEELAFLDLNTNPRIDNGNNNGIMREPTNTFNYNKAECEKVWDGAHNTYIVFGRDRPAGWDSGYGGKGHNKAGAIDIVVGRVSTFDATEYTDKYVNPSIGADASRIYLSQKADIDEYYGIKPGKTGMSQALAAIAMKSDDIRIVARNSIKIVTERDNELSNGNSNLSLVGVQLIANNDDRDMQPIPKGENLVRFIIELYDSVLELNGLVQGFLEVQQKLNEYIANHVHETPFFGLTTNFSLPLQSQVKSAATQLNLKVDQGLKNHASNFKTVILKYITGGPDYINSKYHFLN